MCKPSNAAIADKDCYYFYGIKDNEFVWEAVFENPIAFESVSFGTTPSNVGFIDIDVVSGENV